MTVDEVIDALVALSDYQRSLPFVVAPPEYELPIEATEITYLPADGLVARGPAIVLTTRVRCSQPSET